MMRFLSVLVLCALAACSKSVASTDVEPSAAGARGVIDDSDCNFRTPLVPGIPGSPGHLIKSERNPNGDSELAALMRQFVDDLEEVRVLAQAGKPIKKLHPVHRKMRCSWHTDPKERTEAFDLRAQVYLATVAAFDAAPARDTYNAMIGGCVACHSVSCRGPVDFITKMKW